MIIRLHINFNIRLNSDYWLFKQLDNCSYFSLMRCLQGKLVCCNAFKLISPVYIINNHQMLPLKSILMNEFIKFYSTSNANFHCSICGKAFKLEKSGLLHLKSIHNDQGEIHIGAGTGLKVDTVKQNVNVDKPKRPEKMQIFTSHGKYLKTVTKPSPESLPSPLFHDIKTTPENVFKDLMSLWNDIGEKRSPNSFIKYDISNS